MRALISIVTAAALPVLSSTVVFSPIAGTCNFQEIRGDAPNVVIMHLRECPAKSKADWHRMSGADTTVVVPDTTGAK